MGRRGRREREREGRGICRPETFTLFFLFLQGRVTHPPKFCAQRTVELEDFSSCSQEGGGGVRMVCDFHAVRIIPFGGGGEKDVKRDINQSINQSTR